MDRGGDELPVCDVSGVFLDNVLQSVAGVLLVLVIIKGGDAGQVPTAFTPADASSGWGGIGKAFVFIVLAFFGFESCLTVAEETRNPRRNLPIALSVRRFAPKFD